MLFHIIHDDNKATWYVFSIERTVGVDTRRTCFSLCERFVENITEIVVKVIHNFVNCNLRDWFVRCCSHLRPEINVYHGLCTEIKSLLMADSRIVTQNILSY